MKLRPWLSTRGLRFEDGPVMFAEALAFYRSLPHEIDALGRGGYDAASLQEFALARRQYLHQVLDTALDLEQLLAEAERGCFP